jgi:probable HAF family extracellular repeat protein
MKWVVFLMKMKLFGFAATFLCITAVSPAYCNPVGVIDNNGNVTTFVVPAASYTEAYSINDLGQIVGTSANGGFLYSNGVFGTLDFVYPYGINDPGQIVGYGYPSGTNGSAFYSNGSFTSLGVPGSNITVAYGINNLSEVVGSYEVNNSGDYAGFTYNNGSYSIFSAPGSVSTFATAINGLGQIVGYSCSTLSDCENVFLYSNGTFTTIDFPGVPQGINDLGQIVGYGTGFSLLYSNGTLTTLNFRAEGINNLGQIVGFEGEFTHATPLPGAFPLFSTGLGVMGLFGWRRKRKNAGIAANTRRGANLGVVL